MDPDRHWPQVGWVGNMQECRPAVYLLLLAQIAFSNASSRIDRLLKLILNSSLAWVPTQKEINFYPLFSFRVGMRLCTVSHGKISYNADSGQFFHEHVMPQKCRVCARDGHLLLQT